MPIPLAYRAVQGSRCGPLKTQNWLKAGARQSRAKYASSLLPFCEKHIPYRTRWLYKKDALTMRGIPILMLVDWPAAVYKAIRHRGHRRRGPHRRPMTPMVPMVGGCMQARPKAFEGSPKFRGYSRACASLGGAEQPKGRLSGDYGSPGSSLKPYSSVTRLSDGHLG